MQLHLYPPLEGDPAVLSAEASTLPAVANRLTELAAMLNSIADEELAIGEAVDAMRGRTVTASQDLSHVAHHYTETAVALRDYAVVLSAAQATVARVRVDVESLADQVQTAQVRLRDVHDRLYSASAMGEDAAEIAELQRELAFHRAQISDGEAGLRALYVQYTEQRDAVDAAARRAIALIEMSVGELQDTLLDRVSAFVDDVAGMVVATARWIVAVLDTALTTLLLVEIVVVSLAVVAVTLLVSWLVIRPLLESGLMTTDELVEYLVGIALVVVPVLSTAVATLVRREILTPTPDVNPVLDTLGGRLVDKRDKGDYEYLFLNNAVLDRDGGRDRTIVEVVHVLDANGAPSLDENGNPIWRVTLPSTQDWQLPLSGNLGDAGAVNDLGSNLALILAPDQQAAYQRAVLQAMADAGIEPHDSVMLAGWSQGGILAAVLASDPSTPFNVRAIAVAGSPIDHVPMPESVSVVAFQHDGDIVPRLDGTAPRQGANWVTVTVPNDSAHGHHSAQAYAATASSMVEHLTHGNDPILGRIVDGQSMFFSPHELEFEFEFAETDRAAVK